MDVLIGVLAVVLALVAFQGGWRVAAGRRARRVRGTSIPDDPLFDAVRGPGSALVVFHSPRCAACRRMAPTLQRLADSGRSVLELDVTRHPQPARNLGVLLTPTTLVIRDGRVAETLLGARSEAALIKALNKEA